MSRASKDNNDKRILLTEDIIRKIKSEKKRTQVHFRELLTNTPQIPDGLNETTLYDWELGAQKTANAHHLDFVLKTYGALPSNRLVKITPQIRKRLKYEITRTGVNSERFYEIAENVPDNFLTPSSINNLIVGKAQNIRKSHLDFILDKYAVLPTYKMCLTKDLWQKLADEIARTDIRSASVILDHRDKPEGLTVWNTQDLIRGKLNEIPQKHWDFIIERYQSFPNVETMRLTNNHREELSRQLARTRMNYLRLSNHIKHKTGRKYKTAFLADLQKGKQTSVQKTVWADIISCLKALPNAPCSTGGIKKEIRPTQKSPVTRRQDSNH